ncbi:MAG TPA: peptidylprolyl isomerase [Abditibacteriaceae bacterium]|jgi:parvulin-like peptidyl-prolyl isomerase
MKNSRVLAALCAATVLSPVLVHADETSDSTDGVLIAQAATNKPAAKPAPVAGVAAEVNGEKIPLGDVERAVSVLRDSEPALRTGSAEANKTLENIRQQHLENLITQALLAQDARKRNIAPPKAEVDKAVTALQKGMKPEEFQKALTEDGKTTEDVRRMIVEDMSIRELSRRLTGDITVSDAEIQASYRADVALWTVPETARASHVLIAFKEGATAADKAKQLVLAKDILKQAKNPNTDFTKLAKTYSQDPGSKDQGGDVGDFDRERMVKPFADAVWANPVGSVVGPVESEFGYHIIRITGKKPSAVVPLDFQIQQGLTVREAIRARLLRGKVQTRLEAHLKTLRAAATIKKYI